MFLTLIGAKGFAHRVRSYNGPAKSIAHRVRSYNGPEAFDARRCWPHVANIPAPMRRPTAL